MERCHRAQYGNMGDERGPAIARRSSSVNPLRLLQPTLLRSCLFPLRAFVQAYIGDRDSEGEPAAGEEQGDF